MRALVFVILQWLLLINYSFAGITVSGPASLDFGTVDGDSDVIATADFCVYNPNQPSYRLTASGETSGNNNFILKGTDGSILPIKVMWQTSTVPNEYIELKNNIASNLLQGTSHSANCNGINNGKLKLLIKVSDFNHITMKKYHGNITLSINSNNPRETAVNSNLSININLTGVVNLITKDSITLPTPDTIPSSDIAAYNTACVYTKPISKYRIKAVGNAVNNFEMASPNKNKLPYTIIWYENGSASGEGVILSRNKFITSTNTGSNNCNGTYNNSYKIIVHGIDIDKAIAGTYTDVLKFLLVPGK